MTNTRLRTYSELVQLSTFEERFEYLKLNGAVGAETFGFDRVYNQKLYKSSEWRNLRPYIIARDRACDLGIEDHEIPDKVPIYIHHMNPICMDDIKNYTEFLFNPEFLISTVFETHQAIHYGTYNLLQRNFTERSKFDTCPWKR